MDEVMKMEQGNKNKLLHMCEKSEKKKIKIRPVITLKNLNRKIQINFQ